MQQKYSLQKYILQKKSITKKLLIKTVLQKKRFNAWNTTKIDCRKLSAKKLIA